MTANRHSIMAAAVRLRAGAEKGFSLISAIFLLVVLAALGAAIVNISTVQHTSSALDVQGARAYQSAKAGIEWALYQELQVGGGYCTNAVTTTFALPAATTLNGFSVTVVCTPTAVATVDPVLTARQVVATACNQPLPGNPGCPNANPGPDYVQRVIAIRLTR